MRVRPRRSDAEVSPRGATLTTTFRAILCGVAATLVLGASVAVPAGSAVASPDYTWKWKGVPDPSAGGGGQ